MSQLGVALIPNRLHAEKQVATPFIVTHSGKNTWSAVGFAPGSSMADADITYCQYRNLVKIFVNRRSSLDIKNNISTYLKDLIKLALYLLMRLQMADRQTWKQVATPTFKQESRY